MRHKIPTDLLLEAKGEGGDEYASADSALERLDIRVRRYKRRITNHHSDAKAAAFLQSPASDTTLSNKVEDIENSGKNYDHLVSAETKRMINGIHVSEAVMQLDLTDEVFFLVSRNSSTGQTIAIYRRDDGNVGWIDPKLTE